MATSASSMDDLYTRPKSRPVFDKIRSHILEGQYHPGQWLKQAELEKRYNASRSEVRAALSSLAERGMVEYVKNRGFRIFDHSPEEEAEIIELLTILEVAAVPGVAENVTDIALKKLHRIAEKFDRLIESGNQSELRLSNYEFHKALNELGSNRLIARNIQNLRESFASSPFQRYATYGGLRAASREHFEILEALEARDTERLQALIRDHVRSF